MKSNLEKEKRRRKTAVKKIKPKSSKSVRGSGFTYDEGKERTDQSIPIVDSDTSDINKLPDLGKLNRP